MKTIQSFIFLSIFLISSNLFAQTSNFTKEQQAVQQLFQNLAGTYMNDTADPSFPDLEMTKLVFTSRHDNLVLELETFLKLKGEDWQPEVLATYTYDKNTNKIHGLGMSISNGYNVMTTSADFVSGTAMESYLRPLSPDAPMMVKITHALREDGDLEVGNIFYINDIPEWKGLFKKMD